MVLRSVLVFSLLSGVALASGKKTHEHGVARLDIAAEGSMLEVTLKAPAEVVFGFEHQPKNDKEKKQQADGLAKLKEKFTEIFKPDVGLECALSDSTISLDSEKGHAHSDVNAKFKFTCKKPALGTAIQIDFSQHFSRVKTIRVQVISGEKQSGVVLNKPGQVQL